MASHANVTWTDCRRQQRDFVWEHLNAPLRKGDDCYLVDMAWFRRWKDYVESDEEDTEHPSKQSSHPGRIDLSPVLAPDGVTLKSGLALSLSISCWSHWGCGTSYWSGMGCVKGSRPSVITFGVGRKWCHPSSSNSSSGANVTDGLWRFHFVSKTVRGKLSKFCEDYSEFPPTSNVAFGTDVLCWKRNTLHSKNWNCF